jgi:hypothetical protein
LFEVALAAVKLTHEATTGAEDEVEIPDSMSDSIPNTQLNPVIAVAPDE